MKKRRRGKSGMAITPTFPVLLRDLIPELSARSEASGEVRPPGEFLAGFLCPQDRAKPQLLTNESRKFYDAFLASPAWKAKRERVLARSCGQCEREGCGCQATDVHHLNYDRFGGRELLADLEALCAPHHLVADDERRQELYRAIKKLEREEAEERAFDTWMTRKHGEGWEHEDGFTKEDERERFEEWMEQRRAEKRESGDAR